jgi:hypothetical protein
MQSYISDPAASRPRAARAALPVSTDESRPDSGVRDARYGGTVANGLDSADPGLFDCGTLLKLSMHAPKADERERNIALRACLVVLVGWVPLLLLAAYQTLVLREAGIASFLSDLAVACRSLIAAPLLVLAEWICIPRLGAIGLHFRESGIVSKADDPAFADACASTRRLRTSVAVDVGLIVLAYLVITALMETVPLSIYPAWQLSAVEGAPVYSPAGWWHALVSLPLLIVLLLGWIWRVAVWTRFLYLMSRLDLRLVPAHPDRTAGLRFVAYSVQAFSLVALALGVIFAGSAANRILYRGALPESLTPAVIVLVAVVIVVFAGPLLTFSGHLLRAWRRGTLQYSALAGRLGRQFEGKWFRHGAVIDRSALELPDFSATTDLYQVASNVYEVRLVPISVASLGILVAMAILPFLVLALMFIPFNEIVAEIATLLL